MSGPLHLSILIGIVKAYLKHNSSENMRQVLNLLVKELADIIPPVTNIELVTKQTTATMMLSLCAEFQKCMTMHQTQELYEEELVSSDMKLIGTDTDDDPTNNEEINKLLDRIKKAHEKQDDHDISLSTDSLDKKIPLKHDDDKTYHGLGIDEELDSILNTALSKLGVTKTSDFPKLIDKDNSTSDKEYIDDVSRTPTSKD